MTEAMFYHKISGNRIKCELCPNYCSISLGEYGKCRARYNQDGILYSANYGKTVSVSIDPIEKKPLYHYYPNSNILSIGCNTCNLACDFCQNYTISQQEVPTINLVPDKLLDLCFKHIIQSVAFTYSEPITWYEYIYDCSQLLQSNGIKTVLVTNGYINEEPLKKILPFIDAMNIDLKSTSNDFYRNITQGQLKPVLNTIKHAFVDCHIEVTNLVIPGENDDTQSIEKLMDFIYSISPDIPLHFSRYFPQYKRSNPPTPPKTLSIARQTALNKLNHVYVGNVLTNEESNTYCPDCHVLLISRNNFNVTVKNLTNNRCSNCHTIIYGYFD